MKIQKNTPLSELKKLIHDCKCNACENGCRFGSGILIGDDIEKLAIYLNISVKKLKKEYLEETEEFNKKFLRPKIIRGEKPYGKCIFFDEKNKCTIHKAKPMQCKLSMSCIKQGEDIMLWFMLNHIIDNNDPESIRQYNSYLATGGKTLEGGELADLVPDKKRLVKILGYEIINKSR